MDAAFIYHYCYSGATKKDMEWRWVTGKGYQFNAELNGFVHDTDSTFHYMIHNDVSTLFYNDKCKAERDRRYKCCSKDYNHDRVGSFVAGKVAFSGNDDKLCEGIIMVNTYGKRFLDDLPVYSECEMSKLIFDRIFPCFRNLLAEELAMLYFRHIEDSDNDNSTGTHLINEETMSCEVATRKESTDDEKS